jgi:hypothetical protein
LQNNSARSSPSWARTNDIVINSHALYRLSYRGIFMIRTFKTEHTNFFPPADLWTFALFRHSWLPSALFWSDPRPISDGQLRTSQCFHLRPIKLVVFKWSFYFRTGYLILEGASRLDAFSVYPFRAWLPGYRLGGLTGTPEARPSRSSRTKDSSLQISCARAG